MLQECLEAYDSKQGCLHRVVNPRGSSIKTPFYAIFMAFYRLIIEEERLPDNPSGIMGALKGLSKSVTISRHYATTIDRNKNINMTYGLIEKFFVKKEPPALGHGTELSIIFENSLRRSRIETPSYEFKQGLLRLDAKRDLDKDLIQRIVNTICGIANLGPDNNGYLYIGVVDKPEDAIRIKHLDGIEPYEVAGRHVVGIDREVKILGLTTEKYVNLLMEPIRKSQLSEPLKSQLLACFDIVSFRSFSVIRLKVPAQSQVSFVGDAAFVRDVSSTVEAKGQKLVAISQLFMRK